ncbi:MAG: lytC3 [Acidobacteriaceae bacterium]|nr:lytC3 [Acidobacteriaceae bacterium]
MRNRYLYLIVALFVAVCVSAMVVARQHYWDWSDMAFLYRVHAIAYGTKAQCKAHQYFFEHASNPYACDVAAARIEYAAMGISYKDRIQNYTPFGDWLNCGKRCTWQGMRFHFDEDGIPIVNYDGKYYYNPVTISMYGLAMYGRYIDGDRDAQRGLMAAVAKLIKMQDSRGAFPYEFAYGTYRSGWVSGMAQGLALSLLARVYHLTGDPHYLAIGDKAFDLLVTPSSNGGTLDNLSYIRGGSANEIVFEEYPSHPPGYTLNGFMFAILGVYDWSQVPAGNSKAAAIYFVKAVRSLQVILPYYDLGGFTAYDLGHITNHKKPLIGVNYHATHVYLLHALVCITRDPVLRKYEQLWASYVPQ